MSQSVFMRIRSTPWAPHWDVETDPTTRIIGVIQWMPLTTWSFLPLPLLNGAQKRHTECVMQLCVIA